MSLRSPSADRAPRLPLLSGIAPEWVTIDRGCFAMAFWPLGACGSHNFFFADLVRPPYLVSAVPRVSHHSCTSGRNRARVVYTQNHSASAAVSGILTWSEAGRLVPPLRVRWPLVQTASSDGRVHETHHSHVQMTESRSQAVCRSREFRHHLQALRSAGG